MKRIIFMAVAVLSLSSLSSCSRFETVKGDPLGTKIYTMDNGLKVYMSVNREEPRIQTYIAVKVGGKNDPSETTGLAHYFEHLMFKGTQSFGTSDYAAERPLLDEIEQLFEIYRKTSDEAERTAIYHRIDSISYEASKISIPNEYDKLMSVIGATGTNAWTSHDETVYQENIPSNQIDNWARIQADRFRNTVIRGFHTELETIYEEKNMSLTQDSRKVWAALDEALYPHHPYGIQTVLGTQEHLKNPSITNVKRYHDQYYVPNNIAICVSGDFDPDEMVSTIEKYFGDWEPNPDVPVLSFEKEAPITSPVEKEISGLEAERVVLGWPLPGAGDLQVNAVADIAGMILSNGTAGLIDLDVMQQQKVLQAFAGLDSQADYSTFVAMVYPKDGQTLEEARDIVLDEFAKLRAGDFDEKLIEASINNIRLSKMEQLENNTSRAEAYVRAFINGVKWEDAAKEIERYGHITKDDVVNFARQYLGGQNYAAIYKRLGVDAGVVKIDAPKITPIATNRDTQSAFLQEITNTAVKPIEPRFVDFGKDMSATQAADGVSLLYKKNELNDIFSLKCVVNRSIEEDPALSLAARYIQYLGTDSMSAEEIASKMYGLACSFEIKAGAPSSSLGVSGLSENMVEAMKIVEDLIANAKPDETILANLKADILKQRMNSKMAQSSCFSALQRYVLYGPEFVRDINLSNEALMALTSDELLSRLRDLFTYSQEMLYYGPLSESEVKSAILENHYIGTDLKVAEERYPAMMGTEGSSVVIAPYDSRQLYYLQLSNDGRKFDQSSTPGITMYNEYFGGGMNSIVFQEMREARGLAYSAYSVLEEPSSLASDYCYMAFIATQNDKLQQAVEAFSEIINNMPESEAAFKVAKEAIISRLRTQRTTGASVLNEYRNCRRLGLSEPADKAIFEAVQNITLDDVKAIQQEWVAGRSYTYAILGDSSDIDMDFLKTLGPVKKVSLEEVFGY